MKVAPWRVSFEEVMKPVEGAALNDKVATFIRKLMLRRHWGPFEHVSITFGIEGMSRVTLAQLTRHRLATFDIQSAREIDLRGLSPKDLAWPPHFSSPSAKSREGGGSQPVTISPEERERMVSELYSHSIQVYSRLAEAGVPIEDARYAMVEAVLVNGTMTLNARSLMHVIALRALGDAQWEIRDLVSHFQREAEAWMPTAFRVFREEFLGRRGERQLIGP